MSVSVCDAANSSFPATNHRGAGEDVTYGTGEMAV